VFGRIWQKDETPRERVGGILKSDQPVKDIPSDKPTELPDVIKTGIKGRYSLHDLFDIMIDEDISDLHILPEYPPVFRLYGEIIPADLPALTQDEAKALIYQSISKEEIHKFEVAGDLDSSYEARDIARFRINVLMQQNGVGAVFRQIPIRMPTIDELGLPGVLKKFCHYRQAYTCYRSYRKRKVYNSCCYDRSYE